MNKIIAILLAVAAFFLLNGYDVLSYSDLARSIENPYALSIEAQTGVARALLDDAQQQLYDVMKSALSKHETEILVKRTSYTSEDFRKVRWCLMQDSPDIFWIDWISWTIIESAAGLSITPTYLFSPEDIPLRKAEFDAACEEITALAAQAGASSDYEKALFVHDYLIQTIAYNTDASINVHTAYGAVVEGVSVCDGYAHAYQILMQRLGVDCMYVEGRMKGSTDDVGHAWNIVTIDGVNCHVDVTWDDPDPEYPEGWAYALPVFHGNFLLSDADVFIDHVQENPFALPACAGYNYFGALGLLAETSFSEISANMEQTLYENIAQGKFFVEIRIRDNDEFAKVTGKNGYGLPAAYDYAMEPVINNVNARLKKEKASFRLDTWFKPWANESTNTVLFEVRPV